MDKSKRHHQNRKHDTPFYNVSDTFMVKGVKEAGNIVVKVINKKTSETVKEVLANDKEHAFKLAFDLEMEVIQQAKEAGDTSSINPKAMAAYGKHVAWLERQQATER